MSENESFCIYCQHDYETPQKLRRHIEKKHHGTHAYWNVNQSLAKDQDVRYQSLEIEGE